MVACVLAENARGQRHQIAIVVPSAATWTLPAYELAIMMAGAVRDAPEASVTLVTPERHPLWIFGADASTAMRALLAERGIALRTGTRAVHVTDDVLWLDSDMAVIADTVVSLPRLVGPRVLGLPGDRHGFLPTHARGDVRGPPGVLAAGDATTFPIKQGGLAAQQADAAAATIAEELGALVEP